MGNRRNGDCRAASVVRPGTKEWHPEVIDVTLRPAERELA